MGISESCVHHCVEAVAGDSPSSLALVGGSEELTYGELNARANRLAWLLRSYGVGPGGLVGVLTEPSVERVVAVLAVLKAGAAYLPLDPAYPVPRLAYMVEHSGLGVILTHAAVTPEVAADLGDRAGRVIPIDDQAGLAQQPTENPPAAAGPTDLAYVIYTSGSTGNPKGVMIEHSGLTNLADAQIEAFGISADSRVLAFAPFSFDASVSEIFTALAAGAVLCVPTRDDLRPGDPLLGTLLKHDITVVTLPPSVLATLEPGELPALRTVVSAGEACTSDLVSRWAPGRTFLNAYGPTETTVCATVGECQVGTEITIGKAIKGMEVHILDDDGRPVTPGEAGELYIGGRGVARGYLNAPELTEQRFVSHGGSRLYRSGDLVRETSNGNLVFLGRADDQVKIRGVRIEIGEVEAALRSHPDVEAAAVTAQPFGPHDTRLVAYYVPGDQAPTVAALRSHLEGLLPEVFLPSFFRSVDRLPLTPSGKVDRRALPAVSAVRGDIALREPAGPVEEFVAELWAQVLGLDRVGTDEDFFELGGNSLLATRLVALLSKELDLDVPLTLMIDRPTVEGLSLWLTDVLLAEEAAAS
jgi:amino acid adenylation domain-containing protein